ncbi:type II toxin-antitoxin system VapC family toxin [Candidatus Thiodictyon syntrophicum]|jgi:predicted nucleic acid-binding protein|uniref:Ribonuclease VapC n=1 Tax=Candidatus Thiodictyon syntrophicum TaxID=1166950 RepID=A0A2K8U2L3_9GAMM|nr:type II toxin-antitoxin system VapC family toxin [Candidatus Thiodictyon syntrophicum]AUB79787.1 VapC toxin family PIN domain ribonuclease [Candidatus Thiodictyon syntrophicum]
MNLLDSSGWIEYFANGPNAGHFASVATATATLLVPTIVLHEVYRWAEREGGESAANRIMLAMQEGAVVVLDADLAIAAARLARRHKLPTADSIIYATAQSRGATVWTQDDDFEDLPGVRYFAKSPPGRPKM